MKVVGKTVLGFDKQVAQSVLLDVEYKALEGVVPALLGPFGWLFGYFAKMVLEWQIVYTAWGIKKTEIAVTSFLKNKAYLELRAEILEKGEMNEAEKKRLFKKYVPVARAALTV